MVAMSVWEALVGWLVLELQQQKAFAEYLHLYRPQQEASLQSPVL
jgi:hypothetical protein